MKILPVTFLQNTENNSPKVQYKMFETHQDTFTRTTTQSSPSFRNKVSIVELAQKAIKDPECMRQYAAFTAEAFLALLGIAGGKGLIDKVKTDDNAGNSGITFKLNIQQENKDEEINPNTSEQEIQDLRKENARLAQENTELKQKNAALMAENPLAKPELSSDSSEAKTDAQAENPVQNHIHRCRHIKFPKKNAGRLSDGQKQLKAIAEKLRVNKEYCAKLTAICAKSLEKDVYIIDGKKTDNSKLAMMLAKELTENKKEPEAVIDKYYKLYGLENAETKTQAQKTSKKKSVKTVKKQEENHSDNKTSDTQKEDGTSNSAQVQMAAFENTEQKNESGVKGQISAPKDVEQKDEQSSQVDDKKQTRITPSSAPAQSAVDPLGTCHVEVSDSDMNLSQLHASGEYVVLINPKSDVYSYYDPAAYNQDEYTIFKNMQRRFESAVFKNKKDTEKVSWMTRKETAYKVTDNAVENEIRSLIGESACENLTPEDAEEVADAINADERFGEYFTLHAAIRLIDRFANFIDSDLTLEEQCHEMLDNFVNIVQRAFHNRINIKLYVEEGTGRFGERIYISPSTYYEQDKEYFNDRPLIFGLGKIFSHSSTDRQPVIVTLFNN